MSETTHETEAKIHGMLRRRFSPEHERGRARECRSVASCSGSWTLDAVDLAMELERCFDVVLGELDTYDTSLAGTDSCAPGST